MDLDRTPVYRQIANHYARLIADGIYGPGAQLPPLTEISSRWHVHDGTARRALQELKQDGLVDTSRRGTFVKSSAPSHQQ